MVQWLTVLATKPNHLRAYMVKKKGEKMTPEASLHIHTMVYIQTKLINLIFSSIQNQMGSSWFVHAFAHINILTHACAHMHACLHIQCTCVHICPCVHAHTHTHIKN